MKGFWIAILIVCISGCASIVSKSNYPVSIESQPSAVFTITNKAGDVIHSGTTPEAVTLAAGAGFFVGERYEIVFSRDGHEDRTYTLQSELDEWYIGNILFGGPLGLLIVDPAAGAMYKLPKNVSGSFEDITLEFRELSDDEEMVAVRVTGQ